MKVGTKVCCSENDGYQHESCENSNKFVLRCAYCTGVVELLSLSYVFVISLSGILIELWHHMTTPQGFGNVCCCNNSPAKCQGEVVPLKIADCMKTTGIKKEESLTARSHF